ncbi:MAG: hypothetical protein AAF355_09395 [Myxococcota bacterium]
MASDQPVNVPLSEDEERSAKEIDASWTGPKLIVLCAVTLAIALSALYIMSSIPVTHIPQIR